jgi:hypothetical protein
MGRTRVSIVLVGALALAGCAKKPNDSAIVASIQSQFYSHAELKDSSLEVKSERGEVTLSGTVPSDAAHLEAYKLATETPGVTKVTDQISVRASETAAVTSPSPAPSIAQPRPKPAPLRAKETELNPPDAAPAEPQQVTQTTPANNPPAVPEPVPAAPPLAQPAIASSPISVAPPALQPHDVEVPANTTLTVRLIDTIDSSVNHTGEIFHASLENPVVITNQIVVPSGTDVYVRLTSARSAGRFSGKSELHLELLKMEFQGRSYSLVSSTYSAAGSSRSKNTAEKVGAGAVLGALIGGLAGGGKGAAIGAGVGGGGGAIYNGVRKGKQVKIPSETKLDFQLEAPVTVTVMPRVSSSSASSSSAQF